MDHQTWLAELAAELARRGLDAGQARAVVAEAAAHLRDGGEDPWLTFGDAGTYARTVTEALTPAPGPMPVSAPVREPAPEFAPAPPGRPAPGPVLLEARGISHRYGRNHVLHGVDLVVRAGQIVAVVGANGCGKSTLLRVCAGLETPDSGHVRVSGTVGYCPQSSGTSDFLTPDEHFVLVGAGRGMSRDGARREGRAHARALRWEAAPARSASTLSGGTRQKLNLVMTALGDPDVLLLDEPYQGFDNRSYEDFWDRLGHWRDAGTGIVVVTHLLERLDRADVVVDLGQFAAPTGSASVRGRRGKGVRR